MQEPLSQPEIRRYQRHITLPEVGLEGQQKLKGSKVLVVGAGGLGSPAAMYLAAAGVGTLGLVDFDNVEESNLQRQILHGTSDVGAPKVESADRTLCEINPYVDVELHQERFCAANAMQILESYDLILGGTDNFAATYLCNDAGILTGKPFVYGSIYQFKGQASVFNHQGGPCYRCLFPEMPDADSVPDCATGGVFGVLPGLIGTIQATEAVKLLLGIGEPLSGTFLSYDALSMSFKKLRLHRDPECPVCGDEPSIVSLHDEQLICATHQGIQELEPAELKSMIDGGKDLALVDVREEWEYELASIDGTTLVPLGQLEAELGLLNPDVATVLICHGGFRSMRAATFLQERGFATLYNLKGGIDRWSVDVDSSVPRY